MIKTRNVGVRTPARYKELTGSFVFPDNNDVTGKLVGTWNYRATGVIKNIIFSQPVAGANGTSVTLTIKKNGTSVCSTDAILAVGDGDNASVDSSLIAGITKPSGATRAVLKTDSTITVSMGDDFTADITTTGVYSGTFPSVTWAIIIEPTE